MIEANTSQTLHEANDFLSRYEDILYIVLNK
jgi:hypothetical protein